MVVEYVPLLLPGEYENPVEDDDDDSGLSDSTGEVVVVEYVPLLRPGEIENPVEEDGDDPPEAAVPLSPPVTLGVPDITVSMV